MTAAELLLDFKPTRLDNRYLEDLKAHFELNVCDASQQGNLTPLNKEVDHLQKPILTTMTLALCYSVVHGLPHISLCFSNNSLVSQMRTFFQEQVVYWIEIMSLLAKIDPLVQSMYAQNTHDARCEARCE